MISNLDTKVLKPWFVGPLNGGREAGEQELFARLLVIVFFYFILFFLFFVGCSVFVLYIHIYCTVQVQMGYICYSYIEITRLGSCISIFASLCLTNVSCGGS